MSDESAHFTHPSGPLRIPGNGPDREARKALQVLRGHVTSDTWLPAGVWPLVDELREKHLRQRTILADALADLYALCAQYDDEDRQHDERLRDAARNGKAPSTVQDSRTPDAERESAIGSASAHMWAAVVAMAERVTEIQEALGQHEPELLAELRERRTEQAAKRREAEQALRDAAAMEWKIGRLGAWLKANADIDAGFFGQPDPSGQPVPPRPHLDIVDRELADRSWHQQHRKAGAAA